MKRVLCVVCCCIVASFTSLSLMAMAKELPESIKSQVRKGSKESSGWDKFDKSGPVKFLQVQHTAAASETDSAGKLDGSIGERLIEVLLDNSIEADVVSWSLENKGPGAVFVVASSDDELEEVIAIEAGASAEFSTKVVGAYCYIVVDSDGRDETTVNIKAKAGDTDAKNARGKDMAVSWF